MKTKLFLLFALLTVASYPTSGHAWPRRPPKPQTPASESVFRIQTSNGDGSGFLVNENGLILTNSHVVEGFDSVNVQIDLTYKVRAKVLAADRLSDLAALLVNPRAVEHLAVLYPDSQAFVDLVTGDNLSVLGFPIHEGVVLTKGILSQKRDEILITDATVAPGNSGGPILDSTGRVIGVTTFLTALGSGGGLGGGIPSPKAAAFLASITVDGLVPPPPDSLPVLPLGPFPLASLDRAATSRDWPVKLYDITSSSAVRGFHVRLFTPPLIHYLRHRVSEATSGLIIEDLTYWSMALGQYRPVVIVRIEPRVFQSVGAFLGNILLTSLAGASGTWFYPIIDERPEGSVSHISVQGPAGFIEPIELRLHTAILGGELVQVGYIVLDPVLFRFDPGQPPPQIIINVVDDRGIMPWIVPRETVEQIAKDFSEYFSAKG